jgi:hypothetical protein
MRIDFIIGVMRELEQLVRMKEGLLINLLLYWGKMRIDFIIGVMRELEQLVRMKEGLLINLLEIDEALIKSPRGN